MARFDRIFRSPLWWLAVEFWIGLAGLTANGASGESLDSRVPRELIDSIVLRFERREDDVAYAEAKSMLETAPGHEWAAALVRDLDRRRTKGSSGKIAPHAVPKEFGGWPSSKRIEWLIDSLDEVDGQQSGWPGGVPLYEDFRVAALIEIGDPAVHRLIDTIERDERLTRTIHCWRVGVGCNILSVQEAAMNALMCILKVHIFDAAGTGDNFSSRGIDFSRRMASNLRAYWRKYGSLPFDERMMAMLGDASLPFEWTREAAENLSFAGIEKRLSTTVFTSETLVPVHRVQNPAAEKFTEPTAADAIVNAMERDLGHHPPKIVRDSDRSDYERREIDRRYLNSLVALGDTRVAQKLAERARVSIEPEQEQALALSAHRLGDSAALFELAHRLAVGDSRLLPNPARYGSLTPIIETFVAADSDFGNAALDSLISHKHPLHWMTVRLAADIRLNYDIPDWCLSPFFLKLMRAMLDDVSLTDRVFIVEDEKARWRGNLGSHTTGSGLEFLPEWRDPSTRFDEISARVCDLAAEELGELVWTAARFSPLMRDRDLRIARLKRTLDRYRHRPMSRLERIVAQDAATFAIGDFFMPDIRPLDRPAEPLDVEAGLALFHLDGQGALTGQKLPARARWSNPPMGNRDEPIVIVVQVERTAEGETVCGILFRGGMATVPLTQLTGLESLDNSAVE
jgi:hypothetical protein